MKVLLSVAALLLGTSAYARPAKCLLKVDGTTYIHGTCNYEPFNDGTGSFSIGTDDANSDYFAYVNIYDGVANGSWNGVEMASHAHEDLGPLTRSGACFENTRAKICAWAK